MKKVLFLLLISINCCISTAQTSLNGIWKGTLTQQPGGCFATYNLELQISINENKVAGICYHYSDTKNYVKKRFDGVYHPETKSITIQEGNILTFQIPPDCIPCIKSYDLWYSSNNNETLSGDWQGIVVNTQTACQPGHIVLSRIMESAFEGIQEIYVDTGRIRLDFYDNGIIDNDSISVLVNNKVVLSNEKLAAKPLTIFINVDGSRQMQEVIMKAENLGSIPPNTALLIVTAGIKRYRLYLTSTEKRDASVRFIYEGSRELGSK